MLHKVSVAIAYIAAVMLVALMPVSSNEGFDDIHGVVEFVTGDLVSVSASAILPAQNTGFCKLD